MCISDRLTAVDAPLFILFDRTSFETLHFWNERESYDKKGKLFENNPQADNGNKPQQLV